MVKLKRWAHNRRQIPPRPGEGVRSDSTLATGHTSTIMQYALYQLKKGAEYEQGLPFNTDMGNICKKRNARAK